MTLVFGHFRLPLEDEAKDEEVLTQGEKNIASLQLNPQPKIKKACTCSSEEDANKEK